MNYEGPLFGKIGRRFVPLTLTSQQVDAQSAEVEAMRVAIKEAGKVLLDILRNHECGIEIDLKCETTLANLKPFLPTK